MKDFERFWKTFQCLSNVFKQVLMKDFQRLSKTFKELSHNFNYLSYFIDIERFWKSLKSFKVFQIISMSIIFERHWHNLKYFQGLSKFFKFQSNWKSFERAWYTFNVFQYTFKEILHLKVNWKTMKDQGLKHYLKDHIYDWKSEHFQYSFNTLSMLYRDLAMFEIVWNSLKLYQTISLSGFADGCPSHTCGPGQACRRLRPSPTRLPPPPPTPRLSSKRDSVECAVLFRQRSFYHVVL